MADSGLPNRPSRGSGSLTVHLADELDVYFNEVAHGRPVGFVASPKWKPRTDVYETDEELIVHMDIAGMVADDFSVELNDGILKIAGELIDELVRGERRLLPGVVKSVGGMEPPEGAVMTTLPHQLSDVGTRGTMVRMLKRGDGSVRVMGGGWGRARLKDIAQGEKWL